jgi:hypothetical protein
VLSFRANQLGALSLLKDEIGYYMYPMLTVGSVENCNKESRTAVCLTKGPHESPLMAYRSAPGEDAAVLFYSYGGNSVKTEDGPIMEVKVGDAEVYAFPAKKEDSGKSSSDEKPAAGGEKKDAAPFSAGGQQAGAGGAGDPAAAAQGQQSQIVALLTKIWKCVQHLDQTPSADEVNGNKAPSQDKKPDNAEQNAKKEQSGKDAAGGDGQEKGKKQDSKYSAEKETGMDAIKTEVKVDAKASADASKVQIAEDAKYAAKADRLDALESKMEQKDREDKAIADLTDSGYRLSKSTREMVAKYAAKGESHLTDFVADYKKIAEKDPPPHADNPGTAKVDVDSSLPEEVASYKAKDPKEFSLRKSLMPEFSSYQNTGGTMTFDRYVEGEKARVARGGR